MMEPTVVAPLNELRWDATTETLMGNRVERQKEKVTSESSEQTGLEMIAGICPTQRLTEEAHTPWALNK